MKYLKYFENLQDEPQVGDYVICQDHESGLLDFYQKNIGKIVVYIKSDAVEESNYKLLKEYRYIVEYKKVPKESRNFFHKDERALNNKIISKYFTRRMSREEIKYFSPNREDLEMFITSNKYNL